MVLAFRKKEGISKGAYCEGVHGESPKRKERKKRQPKSLPQRVSCVERVRVNKLGRKKGGSVEQVELRAGHCEGKKHNSGKERRPYPSREGHFHVKV